MQDADPVGLELGEPVRVIAYLKVYVQESTYSAQGIGIRSHTFRIKRSNT
jgi:hypothetical protein